MLACSAGNCVHGRCVNGSCICDNGWTGNVDILTQDLSHANGPVLKCTSHILTLKLMYGFVLGLNFFSIVLGTAGLIQQWHKYKSLVRDRRLQHWYEHTPLVLLVCVCTVGAPATVLVSVVKLSSENLHETAGITPWATWSRIASICCLCLAPKALLNWGRGWNVPATEGPQSGPDVYVRYLCCQWNLVPVSVFDDVTIFAASRAREKLCG
eukprot:1419421-Pleurochrysis_carterae.AAC.1